MINYSSYLCIDGYFLFQSKQISHSRSRYSVSSTPVITKSHATPTRSRRPSIGGMSPLTKSTKKPVMLSSSNPSIGGMSPSTKSTNKLVMPSPSNPSKGGTSPLAKSARKILLPSPAKPVVQKPTFRLIYSTLNGSLKLIEKINSSYITDFFKLAIISIE